MSKVSDYVNSLPDKRNAAALVQAFDKLAGRGLVAAVGSSQATAVALSYAVNIVTDADGTKAARLPTPQPDDPPVWVINTGTSELPVYPAVDGQINALGTDAAFTLGAGQAALFQPSTKILWYTAGVTAGTFLGPILYDHNTTITAFAGGGQASATALTGEFNNVTTCATASDSVKLPAAALGKKITVKNSGATALAVFPASGDAINAMAVNLSVDLAVGGQMTFRAIDGTTWESEEFLISQAPSTQKGSLVVKAADSAGNTVTTVTNASQAAARTYTIPDGGNDASFLLTKGAQTIDGVQTYTAPRVLDSNTTITAFATGGQASATALTGEYNTITVCATANDSVKLPAAVAGQIVTVRNLGAAICAVFPASGDAINALAADLSISLPVLGEITFEAVDGTTWYTNRVISLQAPTTQRGNLVFKPADNAANYEVSVTNASHGQATVHTIPDPLGATGTVVLEELTNVFDLPQRYDANTTITAFATGGQGSATALTGEFNNITTVATAGDSVKLPAAAAGLKITVKNSGATSLAVFPATDDAINALAANLSVDIPVGGELTFRAIDGVTWETNEVMVLPAPATQNGTLLVKASNNAANYAVTITNASHGQATTHTVPDGGAATDYGVYSTAALTLAEADVLDGAVAANSVASKAAMLDSNKRVQTNSNNGTMEAGVTAVFYGDGVNVTAVLTVTNVVITVGNSASLGTGSLLFTLPTGACMIRDAYMSIGISGVSFTTDTPDVGLGTVVASGVVITLDGTPTFENIITGQTATNTNGTATVKGAGPTAGNPLEITTGGAHTVYFNAADGWGANADASGLLNGTVVISYVRQNA